MSTGETGVQVISRAAEILRALSHSPGGLSQAELAERLGLPRTTVHRIVNALEQEGLVALTPNRSRCRLGAEIGRLADVVRAELMSSIRPVMETLSRDLRETVDLSVLDNGQVTFLDQIVGPQRLQAVSGVGESFPLHACAPGKAILAAFGEAALASVLPAHREALTPRTITGRSKLRAELDRIRTEGVAYDREEHTTGICAAAVVLDAQEPRPMALSVPMPASRFYGREEDVKAALLDARQQILALPTS